jgi:hypothetical protein
MDKLKNFVLHLSLMNNVAIFKGHVLLLIITGWFSENGKTRHEEKFWWRTLLERDHMKAQE